MSLPHRVVRVTLSGDMFGGQEQWSTGFYLGYDDRDSNPITPQGVADVGAAWATFFTQPGTCITPQYAYRMCKMAVINNDGKTVDDTAQYWSPLSPAVGGFNAATLPPQIALVASLRNSLPRGLATKGRMFLPGISAAIGNDARIPQMQQATIATNLKTFFDTVYNDADLPGNPVLASVGRGALQTDGAVRTVSEIRLGNVYDTQRRRRNALTETYEIRAVAGL